ncbi:type II toxin-antitoxin system prevent-host-death family antitoxin [Vulcanococcus limneticus]|uniref:type II toxin-antitoxin system prevent-host-death family antitoxin n=1 Tax=Vulcanococcus limneticus TaxID=2170428 RepID=UPI00398BC55F
MDQDPGRSLAELNQPTGLDQLGVEAARRRLPELISRAAAGQATVISRHGQPLAALVPVDQATEKRAERDPALPQQHQGDSHPNSAHAAGAGPSSRAQPGQRPANRQPQPQNLLSLQGSGRRCWELHQQRPARPAPEPAAFVQPLQRHQAFAPHLLSHGASVAIDGSALVAFLCDAPGTGAYLGPLLQGIAQGYWRGVLSSLSLARVLEGPLARGQEPLAQRYGQVFSDPETWTVLAPDAGIVAAAVRLRLQDPGLDDTAAIELATAIQANAAVLVSDNPALAHTGLAATEHLPVLSALRRRQDGTGEPR